MCQSSFRTIAFSNSESYCSSSALSDGMWVDSFSLDDIGGGADGGEVGFIVCGFAKAEDSSVEDMIAMKAKGAQLKLVQSSRLVIVPPELTNKVVSNLLLD